MMTEPTVVVTGADREPGTAITDRFLGAGANVVASARDRDRLEDLVERFPDGAVTTVRADARDEFDLERLMERAARITGDIDVVVAAESVRHGPGTGVSLRDESYAAFDDHLRTNARGVYATIVEALPHLAADARILVPTDAGEDPVGDGTYGVSRATARVITVAFAAELDHAVSALDVDRSTDPETVAAFVEWASTNAFDEPEIAQSAWEDRTR